MGTLRAVLFVCLAFAVGCGPYVHRAGTTPDGRAMYRTRCAWEESAFVDLCNQLMIKACGGDYATTQVDGSTTLVTCGAIPSLVEPDADATRDERKRTEKALVARLSAAEPPEATADERCAYWRGTLKDQDVDRSLMVKHWVTVRIDKACEKPDRP